MINEEDKIIAVTYRFYTKKGQRIAAYAQIEDKELVIVEIRCSKKDHFEKSRADTAFSRYLGFPIEKLVQGITVGFPPRKKNLPVQNITFHPVVTRLELSSTPKKQFLEFMNENYYRLWDYPQRYTQKVLRHYGSKPLHCIPLDKPRRTIPRMSDFI